jgi:hypothetical protein
MSLLKGSKKMKTKKEIEQKLSEAETNCEAAAGDEQNRLSAVVMALRWVLGIGRVQEPVDPVDGE